jgi:hypothetical protein
MTLPDALDYMRGDRAAYTAALRLSNLNEQDTDRAPDRDQKLRPRARSQRVLDGVAAWRDRFHWAYRSGRHTAHSR